MSAEKGPSSTSRLDLRHQGLRSLPREVFDQAETLEILDLSGNALDSLPVDFHRLQRLKVLFCSDNPFTELPAVLGRCPALEMVGFKANHIVEVHPNALPHRLRWLILTDNAIETLPENLGRCSRLQKLMLAGNRLRRLPSSLASCMSLELLRLSANAFAHVDDALPAWLLKLPRLSWLAYAANPFSDRWQAQRQEAAVGVESATAIRWQDLHMGERLGEGASGTIHAAQWRTAEGVSAAPRSPARSGQSTAARGVAVKLFKGAITSDGLPSSEMAACLAAGHHNNLAAVLGHVAEHPQGQQGLVIARMPPRLRNLAGPPSLESCTRDVYEPETRFHSTMAQRIVAGITKALGHLHQRGLLHGDLYAHNILVDVQGHAMLSDFGAASPLPTHDAPLRHALMALDQRALSVLNEELAQRSQA
jgi:Protein tyrosine and serine/threonine kinase/Leucine rich repeat